MYMRFKLNFKSKPEQIVEKYIHVSHPQKKKRAVDMDIQWGVDSHIQK